MPTCCRLPSRPTGIDSCANGKPHGHGTGAYRRHQRRAERAEGRIVKSDDDLNVWIRDDGNHIPVLVQAKILVGSIKMELSGYEGLTNTIAKE